LDTEPNPYRRQNRFYKATRIVDRIENMGLHLFNVRNMSPKYRAKISAEAGFPAPSEETWDCVIDLFSKRVVSPLVLKAAALSTGSACTPLRLY
jgi:hypothetical protein